MSGLGQSPDATDPISEAEFDRLLRQAGVDSRGGGHLAAGVSGGADSMALAFLAARWCRAHGQQFTALIVDHGLRPEAAEEARRVAGRLRTLDICAEILRWNGAKPATGIQAAAREARFALLGARARELGASALLLAHHQGDQAETLLMRLRRDSGPDGLAGIRLRQNRAGTVLLRPLLPLPPLRLRVTCLTGALPWVEDPSNHNRRFERVRMRQASGRLAGAGLTAARLQRMASVFARLRDWSDDWLAGCIAEIGRIDRRGFAVLDAAALSAVPEPLRLKCLSGLLQAIGGGAYPPRSERLARVDHWLREECGQRTTTAGCVLWRGAGGVLWIARETPREGGPVLLPAQGPEQFWDGRFQVRWAGFLPAWIHMRRREGDRRLLRLGVGDARERALPQRIRTALPVVTDLDGRLFAPHFPEVWTDLSSQQDNPFQIEFCPAVRWVAKAFWASRDDSGVLKD